MTRLMLMTFFTDQRWGGDKSDVHPHESPAVMTVPLIVLGAALAAFAILAVAGLPIITRYLILAAALAAASARAAREDYAWDTIAAQHLELYRRLSPGETGV